MSPIDRRSFLKLGVATAAGVMLPAKWHFDAPVARAFYQSTGLKKFIQPLRGAGKGGIPIAATDGFRSPITHSLHYTIDIQQLTDQLHPNLGPTTLWGYNPAHAVGFKGAQSPTHLGGIIVARRDEAIQITFRNKLPTTHILPVDRSANFPDAAAFTDDRASIHAHGGFVSWTSDGGPMTWFDSKGGYGPSVNSTAGNIFKLLNPKLQPGEGEYFYPIQQSARLVWYHDHSHDITRLNAYAGMASAFIIRDGFEALLLPKGLPEFLEKGGREIPIIIQDKIFVDASTIDAKDHTWPGPKTTGSLWYPHVYEPDRWELAPGIRPLPDPSVVPEMFGDTMLANGTVYPVASVQPRRYRLRVLNACQARFLNLQLYVDDGSTDGITLNSSTFKPTNAKGPDFLVIGAEGGFLPNPALVPSNQPFNPVTLGGSLITAPAERWDIIIDFGAYAGKKVILYNDAPAPFPIGDPINDYSPGIPGNPTQPVPGFGPNTRQIMRFDVGPKAINPQDKPLKITTATDLTPGNDPLPVPCGVTAPPPGVPIRQLTLNETFDQYGRLYQLLGTNVAAGGGGFGRRYLDAATETPKVGTTEVWQISNLTGDTHPIHFHLVNVQIISRQPFDVGSYDGTPTFTGPPRPAEATESGWKETVRMNPGEVTTVIMRFTLPKVPFKVPLSPNPNLGVQGHEYVWHCHILDHEEHDMMRPLVILP